MVVTPCKIGQKPCTVCQREFNLPSIPLLQSTVLFHENIKLRQASQLVCKRTPYERLNNRSSHVGGADYCHMTAHVQTQLKLYKFAIIR